MGTLLYQWSTAAQLVSVLMIATFSTTLARDVRRYEVRTWAASWWWNSAALLVAASFWFFVPSMSVIPIVRFGYVGCKAMSALLLVNGALAMRTPGMRWLGTQTIALVALVLAVVGGVYLVSIDRTGISVQGGLGILLLATAARLMAPGTGATGWLTIGILLRGAFSLAEGVMYYAESLPAGSMTGDHAKLVTLFLAAGSSIDLGFDWLVALGGFLAIARRNHGELEVVNANLLIAQEELRRLADRDALTGLANRRALPDAFRSVFDTGAVLIFFDLDGFKGINDTLGHAAGDAYLIRFATALRTTFRPDDVIVRNGGDEFVVVAEGLSLEMANERLDQLRASTDVRFSAGIRILGIGGDGDAMLKEADEAMYAQKASQKRPSIRMVRQAG